MFKRRILTSLFLLPLALQAQTAADYLHGGAQDYIFGKEERAKTKLTEGVQRFPDDAQIRAVLALIREQEKSPSPEPKSSEDQKQDEQPKEDKKPGEKGDAADQKPEEKKDGTEKKQDQGDPQQSEGQNGKPEQKTDKQGEEKAGETGQPEDQSDKKVSGEVKANPSQPQDQKDAQEEAAAEEQAAVEGRMTERQAKALLESLKGEDDRVRLLDPNERKRAGRVLRDW